MLIGGEQFRTQMTQREERLNPNLCDTFEPWLAVSYRQKSKWLQQLHPREFSDSRKTFFNF